MFLWDVEFGTDGLETQEGGDDLFDDVVWDGDSFSCFVIVLGGVEGDVETVGCYCWEDTCSWWGEI